MKYENQDEELLYLTVRLEATTSFGTRVGTGFVFRDKNKTFIVTNKHFVKDVLKGHYFMIKANAINKKQSDLIIRQGVSFDFLGSDFVCHPDPNIDVAIADISEKLSSAFNDGNQVFYTSVDRSIIPNEQQINEFISPLEDIVFIGYPNGLWDSINFLPIIRKGITATPYYYDFMNEKKFLIDASVFPGSSGSPVFIYYSGIYSDKKGNLYSGNKMFFLGIVSQTTYQKIDENEIYTKNVSTRDVPVLSNRQMIDLGVVLKASTIIETIDFYLNLIVQNKE